LLESFQLDRNPKDKQLKAYNAADELFLKRINPSECDNILIINDPFGAICVALAECQPALMTDSAMAQEAVEHNCTANHAIQPRTLKRGSDERFSAIAVVMPKSVNYFAYLLELAVEKLSSGGKVYVLGMVKHTARGHVDTMNDLFNGVNPGKAEKKARVVELTEPTQRKLSQPSSYLADSLNLNITNLPGCYGANGLDQGARQLLSKLNDMTLRGPALDLGCGNGVLSIGLLKHQPDLHLTLVDESLAAIHSAQHNIEAHFPTATADYYHSNGMNSVPEKPYALILCNPPFHQEGTVTEGIANKLFRDMSRALHENGECWIVANRHLYYYKSLRRWFGDVQVVSNDPKFNVFLCRK
jgi:16S rRNA G1207 methylase RsmC